jgi:CMP-N,N'-diacetyllegionaminic acid synthase
MKRQNEKFDYVVLLQPTSPLRSAEDIDAAFDRLFRSDADALISVCQYDKKVLKTFLQNDEGYLHGIANNSYPFMRRQDLPDVLMPNGAIYIIEVDAFLKEEKLFTSKTIAFTMNDESSVDVDTLEDLQMIEKIIAVS